MEKIKDIGFLVFSKHLFWTLATVILLMGLVAWWMATEELAGQYDTRVKEVEGAHGTIDGVTSRQVHQIFNDDTHAGMEAENTRRAKEVYLAWREKYTRQQEDVLVWPDELSDKFVREIERILDGKPIEEVNLDGGNDLITTQREEFRDRINELLPKLAETINAQWDPAATETGNRGGSGRATRFNNTGAPEGEGEQNKDDVAVAWDKSNQGSIRANHFNFTQGNPSTIEILYAMEDYWVLKALMQIIARTNTDESGEVADARYKAAIREIHSIQIGRSITDSNVGRVYRMPLPEGASAPDASSGDGGGGPRAEGGGADGELSATAAEVNRLKDKRYQDKDGNLLSAEKLNSAASGTDEADAYLAVAKRMPVRMRVKMDQRKLNKFLVECGNGDLMLEVEQVRINPDAADVMGQTSQGGSGRAEGRFVPRDAGDATAAVAQTSAEPWDVVVEVHGIIYIFNPPSVVRLKLTEEDKQKLDAVDLEDTQAVEAAAAEPSEGTPAVPGDAPETDADAEEADPPAADGGEQPATEPPEEAAQAPAAAGAPDPAG